MSKEERLLIVYFIIILVLAGVVLVVFFNTFQKRKNKMLIDRFEAEQKFQKEIEKSKLEIQEQTFKNIAWELHDNVGQLLSVVNIQLNMMLNGALPEQQEQIKDAKSVLSDAVTEIRSMSKLLNNDVILKNGLVTSLELEIARFNKLNYLDATHKIEGNVIAIKSEHEIIIFRILQEFLSNVMRHAKAKKLIVLLSFKDKELEIMLSDDGVGFDTSQTSTSSGMSTMKSRADLIKANFSLTSKIDEGTTLILKYPYA